MKSLLPIFLLVLSLSQAYSQELTIPPNGDNQKALVSQWIGLAGVTILYHSPDVHGLRGEDRKGHIWGELVPYGLNDEGFGPSTAIPWRAGANENTIVTFSHDVKVGGQSLKAGSYGLFLKIEKEKPWMWIFSRNTNSWGSYYYNPTEDVLQVEAAVEDAPYTEWLTYGFDNRLTNSAVAFLQWENKKISFKVEVPNVNELYVAKMREDLRGWAGFNSQNYATAAQWCAQNNINLQEALVWADKAITVPFRGGGPGTEDFSNLQIKASVLQAMGRTADAEEVMNKAIRTTSATAPVIYFYGRSLLMAGKNEKAMEVFKYNQQRFPEDKFFTAVGLARGFTAVGDKKNAIKNWEIVIKNVPESQKSRLPVFQEELRKLKEGK